VPDWEHTGGQSGDTGARVQRRRSCHQGFQGVHRSTPSPRRDIRHKFGSSRTHTHTHTHTHKHKHTHKRTRTSTSTSIGPSKTSHTLSTADEFTNLRAAEEGSSPLEGHWNLHNGHNGTVDFALTARAEENRQTPMVPSGRRLSTE
jgi:hypothetical protein